MNKKLLIINILIILGLVLFAGMSITIYYLIPAAGSAIDILEKAIQELLRLIGY